MIYLILYLISGVVTILAEYAEYRTGMYVSKVLLMPLLALYCYQQSKEIKKNRFIYLALFFSWWGDIFLMFPRNGETSSHAQLLFIAGLASFLIGHVNYIIHFIKEVKPQPKATIIVENPYMVLPFLLYLFLLLKILYPGLGPMRLPVTIYGMIITLMAITAFNRRHLVREYSFRNTFIGAILFVLSDSCIAINVFYKHFGAAPIVIMSTYIVAQWLIIKGVLTAEEKNKIA